MNGLNSALRMYLTCRNWYLSNSAGRFCGEALGRPPPRQHCREEAEQHFPSQCFGFLLLPAAAASANITNVFTGGNCHLHGHLYDYWSCSCY